MPLWFGQTVGYKNNQKAPKPSFKGEQFQGVPNGRTDAELLAADVDGYIANSPDNNSCVYGLKAFPDWNANRMDGNAPSNTVVPLPLR